MYPCPKCHNELTLFTYEGVELLKCSGCQGFWFKDGTFRKVKELGMEKYEAQPIEYNPLHGAEVIKLFDPNAKLEYGPESKTVHLWNEIWRRFGIDKNRVFHPESFIEIKKRELL